MTSASTPSRYQAPEGNSRPAPVRYNPAVPTPFDDAAIACVAPDTVVFAS